MIKVEIEHRHSSVEGRGENRTHCGHQKVERRDEMKEKTKSVGYFSELIIHITGHIWMLTVGFRCCSFKSITKIINMCLMKRSLKKVHKNTQHKTNKMKE